MRGAGNSTALCCAGGHSCAAGGMASRWRAGAGGKTCDGAGGVLQSRRTSSAMRAAMANRQAGMFGCERQGDGGLAIVLLAELATILPTDANRVGADSGTAGVIYHPAANRPPLRDDRQHPSADSGQQGIIGPVGRGDEVKQGLVCRLHARRINASCHRLDALSVRPESLAVEGRRGIFGPGKEETPPRCRDIWASFRRSRRRKDPPDRPARLSGRTLTGAGQQKARSV